MLPIRFDRSKELKILCLGAHSDDLEIGCGGTLLKTFAAFENVQCYWVVFSANGKREKEAIDSAKALLQPISRQSIITKRFQDGYFPFHGGEIKNAFEEIKGAFSPDLVLTHYRDDRHQDHRLISDLTWNTFRDHLILEYEIPKYDGDLGNPNLYITISEDICEKKVDHVMRHFPSQESKHWFTKDAFFSILRLRGIESGSQEKYAEAFYSRKMVAII